jgi:hypothetical protein
MQRRGQIAAKIRFARISDVDLTPIFIEICSVVSGIRRVDGGKKRPPK